MLKHITLEKVRSLVTPLFGQLPLFYCVMVDGKRVGTINMWSNGAFKYDFCEDFKKGVHSRENRPLCKRANTLKEIRDFLNENY